MTGFWPFFMSPRRFSLYKGCKKERRTLRQTRAGCLSQTSPQNNLGVTLECVNLTPRKRNKKATKQTIPVRAPDLYNLSIPRYQKHGHGNMAANVERWRSPSHLDMKPFAHPFLNSGSELQSTQPPPLVDFDFRLAWPHPSNVQRTSFTVKIECWGWETFLLGRHGAHHISESLPLGTLYEENPAAFRLECADPSRGRRGGGDTGSVTSFISALATIDTPDG